MNYRVVIFLFLAVVMVAVSTSVGINILDDVVHDSFRAWTVFCLTYLLTPAFFGFALAAGGDSFTLSDYFAYLFGWVMVTLSAAKIYLVLTLVQLL